MEDQKYRKNIKIQILQNIIHDICSASFKIIINTRSGYKIIKGNKCPISSIF